jgi:hypothetical protein
MSFVKHIFVVLSITIAIAFASETMLVSAAQAVTLGFQWHGQTGYSAKGSFSYDEATAIKTIAEKGIGKTKSLQSLTVTFYDRSGKAIVTYEDVVDGVAKTNYFEFNFDPITQQIVGAIDIGGELAGEMYLKGAIAQELSLLAVGESDRDRILDRDVGFIAATDRFSKT